MKIASPTPTYPLEGEQTELTKQINAIYPHLKVHVSKVDNKQLAYTPDRTFQTQNRILRQSIHKFLEKYFFYLPEHTLHELAANHLAEISTEVEFINFTKIAHTYDSLDGTSLKACMNDHKKAIPPTEVYRHPNIALAVIRDTNNNIIGRSLVRLKEKVYIRCYGSPLLKSRLERLGYKPGNWIGQEFNTINLKDDLYVLPYLDADGSVGSNICSSVALLDGKITGVPLRVARLLGQTAMVQIGTTTYKETRLTNTTTASLSFVDVLDGKTYSRLEHSQYKVYQNGSIGFTRSVPQSWHEVVVSMEPKEVAFVDPAEPTVYFNHNTYLVSTCQETLLARGCLIKHPYKDGYMDSTSVHETIHGTRVPRSETIRIVKDGVLAWVHPNELVTTGPKAKRDIKLRNGWLAAGEPYYITPSGRKVHPKLDSVHLTVEGCYDYGRNIERISNTNCFAPKDRSRFYGLYGVDFPKLVKHVLSRLELSGDLTAGLNAAIRACYNSHNRYGTIRLVHQDGGVSRVRITQLNEMELMDAIPTWLTMSPTIEDWPEDASLTLLSMFYEHYRDYYFQLVEANAKDYNHA